MKKQLKNSLCVLLLTAFVALFYVAPAFAQEYKEAYNTAREAAQARDYDTAYEGFTRAAQLAVEAGDQDVADRSKKILAQLDFRNGKTLSDAENFEAAIEHFDKGIAHYPSYINNYQGRALALRKLNLDDESIAAFLKVIEVGESNSDHNAISTAQESIRNFYHFKASASLAQRQTPTRADAEEAMQHLAKLQEYLEPDADTYFYLATAHSVLGDFDIAVTLADQALGIHRGSRNDKAKIFFVKGEALMYMGRTADAKEAFQNAAFGTYKASAEHYLETL